MHVRQATREDLGDIATVVARAMMDDDLALWLMPTQQQNPGLVRERNLRRTKYRWNNGLYLVVAVSDEKDADWTGKSTIMGYAAYEKEIGAPDDSSKRNKTLPLALERWLCKIEDNYNWYFRNNLGTDKARLALLEHEFNTNEAAKRYPKSWELSILAVDPAFGRRGLGAALIAWGKARAQEDKVPLWLLGSSQKGYGLYKRQGFEEFARVKNGNGESPAPAMVWLPESLR